jgi:hypothetical protein
MALILIRADNKEKLLNGIADVERHAKLKILGIPRAIASESADNIVQEIIKQKLRSKSKKAVIVRVEEDTTKSIVNIRKIHPPAHLMVISEEYDAFKDLEANFKELKPFRGYYSPKNPNSPKRKADSKNNSKKN